MGELLKSIATKEDLLNLRKDLTGNNSTVIKWMFIFWLSQFGATIAAVVLLLKKSTEKY